MFTKPRPPRLKVVNIMRAVWLDLEEQETKEVMGELTWIEVFPRSVHAFPLIFLPVDGPHRVLVSLVDEFTLDGTD
jgi:hypothetical protein